MANITRGNPHKEKLFGVQNLYEYKGSQGQKD